MALQNMTVIFIDASAFIALYLKVDKFHPQAVSFLKALPKDTSFITSNFILDEVYTFLRTRKGKKIAVAFAEFLAQNAETVKINRVTLEDEKAAFGLFKELNFSELSFTDCVSFVQMKRLGLKEVFTFDRHFTKAGFEVLP